MVLKSIGLTGASGMVGRHILRLAAQRGIHCRASSRSRPHNLQPTDSWSHWDLQDWRQGADLDAIFGGVDALIHAGAIVAPNRSDDMGSMLDANVRACICVGEWARNNDLPLVYISGATVYADPTRASISENAQKTNGEAVGGFYGLTKYLGELVLLHLQANGLRLVILRPASIYGPGLPAGKLVRDFIDRAYQGGILSLTQPVEDRYNLVHASDVAAAAFSALATHSFGVFNIAGVTISMAELAKSCISVAGRGSLRVDDAVGRPPRTLFDLDCTAAEAAFGYRPSVSVEEGLRAMIEEVLHRE